MGLSVSIGYVSGNEADNHDISFTPELTYGCRLAARRYREIQVSSNTKLIKSLFLPSELPNDFSNEELIGFGSTSKVYTINSNSTGIKYACKVIDKKKLCFLNSTTDIENILYQLRKENFILKQIDHPHIVKIFDVIETTNSINIIMEHIKGAELFQYLCDFGPLCEKEVKIIISSIFSAVEYLHSKGIVHRDIKTENILIHRQCSWNCNYDFHPSQYTIKIIDFGFSTILKYDMSTSFLGSGGYLAPEIRQQRSYGSGVDIWACGIMTHLLLCGQFPFGADITTIPTCIKECKELFRLLFEPADIWGLVSSSAKDFISHCLDVDPLTRISATQALDLDWLSDCDVSRVPKPTRQSKHRHTISNYSLTSFSTPPTTHRVKFRQPQRRFLPSELDLWKNESSPQDQEKGNGKGELLGDEIYDIGKENDTVFSHQTTNGGIKVGQIGRQGKGHKYSKAKLNGSCSLVDITNAHSHAY